MGWIKVGLDDDYHERLREEVAERDEPTHEVAAEMLESYMDYEGIQFDPEAEEGQ